MQQQANAITKKLHRTSEKRRIRLGVYAICVAFSALFWFLIKMSQDYTINVRVPITFIDIPTEKTIGDRAEKDIEITVTSNGFLLFRFEYFKQIAPLEISLESTPYRKINQTDFFISTGNVKALVADYMGLSESSFSIDENQLQFRLENLLSKEVAVIPTMDFQFRQQFGIYGTIKVEPATIKIYGSKENIDTIQAVYTSLITASDVHKEMTFTAEIDYAERFYKPDIESVEVTVPIEQFTESSLLVRIDFPGKNNLIKLFPDKAEVFYVVPLKEFMKIQPALFSVVVDTTGLFEKRAFLNIGLDKQPEQVRVTRIHPSQVEYILVD
jgi:hypothetical protein